MRLALVQFNALVGDVWGNAGRALEMVGRAAGEGADLVVLPELAITGYPPRDLLNQEGFVGAAREAAIEMAEGVGGGVTVVVGCPWKPRREEGGGVGLSGEALSFDEGEGALTNSLLVMRGGRITHRYDKRLLPTYDVFDEDRYFTAGSRAVVIEVCGVRVGLSVCEDLWKGVDVGPEVTAHHRYEGREDPVGALVEAGARLIVNANGSPFVLGKRARQRAVLTRHVERHGVAIASVNQVGGNDDLIFDGHAAVHVAGEDGRARLVGAGRGFVEEVVFVDLPEDVGAWSGMAAVEDPLLESAPMKEMFEALVLGVRDYLRKTGFSRAIVGVSGGIDSAVTATIAAAALGAENVLGVAMPSRYSSEHSVTDAEALARSLGIGYVEVPIEGAHAAVEGVMRPAYESLGMSLEEGVTEENLQSRLRGLVVMALSNKGGAMVLTTGNKSELAVGYCTLYGDMNGGLAVLSDVSKVEVYALAEWVNGHFGEAGFGCAPIPRGTIEKPPSAELRPGQIDQDTLPAYEDLDEIIERYVERHQSVGRIVEETGLDAGLVGKIVRLIDVNEYKRKQMPLGLKVSSIAFGRGRRRPLAQGYRAERAK